MKSKELREYETTYRGKTIKVIIDSQAHVTNRYVAICDGESAWGDSPEYAIQIVKSRIDYALDSSLQKLTKLSENEEEQLRKYVNKYSFEIKSRLKTKHFISTYGDPLFSEREIVNNTDTIQDELNKCGYSFELTSFKFKNNNREYYALIDAVYYSNKKYKWFDELADKILMRE